MNDAEKVREDYRWLRDVVTDGSLDRDQSYALALYDSILTENEGLRAENDDLKRQLSACEDNA